MSQRSHLSRGFSIAIMTLVGILLACNPAPFVKTGENAASELKLTKEIPTVVKGERAEVAVRTTSKLDNGLYDAELVTNGLPAATAEEVAAVSRADRILEVVKEKVGDLFVAAICDAMDQILQWRDPGAVASPDRWKQFITEYVSTHGPEVASQLALTAIASRSSALVDTLQLDRTNAGKAKAWASACVDRFKATSSTPTPRPIPTTTTTSQPNQLLVGDRCVVGRWTGQSSTISQTLNGTSVTLSGGNGAVLTVSGDGRAFLDFGPSVPFVGSYQGRPVSLQLRGTVTSRIKAIPLHALGEVIEAQSVTQQWVINGQVYAPTLSLEVPSNGYSCSSTMFTETTNGVATSYARG